MRRAKLLFLAIASTVSGVSSAATPALEFFDSASRVVTENYFAPSGVNVAAALAEHRAQLERVCSARSTCEIDVGIDAAIAAVAGFNDPHARIEKMPAPPQGAAGAPSTATPRGPVAPAHPLGWQLRHFGKNGPLYVAWIAPGGPADRAGIRRHDMIVAPAGLAANVLAARNEPTDVTWTRGESRFAATLQPDSQLRGPRPLLRWVDDIAVLHFPTGSGEGVGEEAHALVHEANAKLARGLVLDLRDNPGGGMECAVMASAFVEYSIEMRDRAGNVRSLTVTPGVAQMAEGDQVQEARVAKPARFRGPLAILVNKNTGSCAEAVAIQASLAKRAVIVGEESVGVGNNIVQPFPLSEGYRAVVPVSYNFTPDGEALPRRPALDVRVADDVASIGATGVDPVLDAGIAALRTP